MIEFGLVPLLLLVGTAWFGWASYRRAVQAEQALAEVNAEHRRLMNEVRGLERAVSAAEQGLRTLSSHPSVPRDVAVTADLTLADVRRIVEDSKELGN